MACYDNQDIWYDLIHQALQNNNEPSWLHKVASREIEFSRAMRALLSFSLVQLKPESSSYSLHPVVQDWCQGYMQEENTENRMIAIAIISTGFSITSSDKAQYWVSQQRLLPHADHIFKVLQNKESLSEQPTMLHAISRLGILYADQGKLQEAKKMYQRALAGTEKMLGPDHPLTLIIVSNLGNLYQGQGKLQEAEKMYQRALAGIEKVLGPDHPLTLTTVNNLGSVYQGQGKLQEAEKMYRQALAGIGKVLGPNHPLTLIIVGNLGSVYQDQGKLQEAEKTYQRALGPDHLLNSTSC
jgi:tetratricopeptide (TPR) repeat protein